MLRAIPSLSFGGFRILLSVFTLASLLLGGGTYAHSDEIGFGSRVHSASETQNHKPAFGCPLCKGDERPVHCGSSILMTAAVADLDHPALAPQTTDIRYSQLSGLLLIPESPPPRAFPVFEI